MEEEITCQRTPTQILIRCMEDFGDDEPLEVIVVYRTKGGDLVWSSNIVPDSHFVGMLRMTEFYFLAKHGKIGG